MDLCSILGNYILEIITLSLSLSLSLKVALATFATYALVHRNSPNPDDRLTADKAFVALSLFNIIRFPISMLPMLISNLVQVRV